MLRRSFVSLKIYHESKKLIRLKKAEEMKQFAEFESDSQKRTESYNEIFDIMPGESDGDGKERHSDQDLSQ